MKHLFLTLIILFTFAFPSVAQTPAEAEVKRNVNLRPDPTKENDPIELLRAPEKLQLLDLKKQRGYYHVRTADGDEGWVWARNVRLAADAVTSGSVPEPGNSILAEPLVTLVEPVASGIVDIISPTWRKYPPRTSKFRGTEGTCPAEGNGKDLEQYLLKNRFDLPSAYHDVSFDAVTELPFPGKGNPAKQGPVNRRDWLTEHFAVTNPFEGIPIRVEGYLIVIRDQDTAKPGKGEGTNCGFATLGNIDAHIALVKQPNDPESTAVVVEWTPRFTQIHPNWTKKKLLPWTKTGVKVRISGWLMVDPNHYSHITGVMLGGKLRKFRQTLWEIHPITEIEVEVNGRFVDLDNIP